MTINLQVPAKGENLKPTITVVGVGGAGGNAVNNMIAAQLEGVNFVVGNTDAQALDAALTDRVIQLGAQITQGLGAGASPDIGKASAEEALDEVLAHIEGSHMVFITAGMGGGTGTGAAPVIAKAARDRGILTVAVVTKPFHFEGSHRMKLADSGLDELQQYVDTMIVIPNQNLFRVANEKTTFADAFRMADEVLHSGVRGVTDLMIMPGLINLDFADIRTVMREMGKAMMGTGEAEGERRAIDAAEAAISNPLLDDVSMKGARGVLINITGGNDMTLFEVDEAANRIRDEVDADANIIFGSTFNEAMQGKMRVSVVATGIDHAQQKKDDGRTGGVNAGSGYSQRGQQLAPSSAASHANASAATEEKRSSFGGTRFFSREQQGSAIRSSEIAPHSAAPTQQMASPARSAAPAPAALSFVDESEGHFEFAQEAPQSHEREEAAYTSSAGRHAPTRVEAVELPQMSGSQQEAMHDEPSLLGPRSVASSRAAEEAKVEQPALWDEEEEGGEQPTLIRRMTSRFSPRQDGSAQRAEVSEVVPETSTQSEEDYLEIPAFLRRQAN